MAQRQYLLYLNLYILILIATFIDTNAQDNIFQFSPNQPHCLGEEVSLTCYLFPTGIAYSSFALISFNGSTLEAVATINTNRDSIGYSATVAIPVMGSSARIQLTIASFKESDNNTLFGCHAELATDASRTAALESGYPPIAIPPSTPTIVVVSSTNCTNTLIYWTAPASDRDIERYYVYRNSTLLTVTTDTLYTDRDQLLVNTLYQYSVIANSCAGNSIEGIGNSIIKAPVCYTPILSTTTLLPPLSTLTTVSSDQCLSSTIIFIIIILSGCILSITIITILVVVIVYLLRKDKQFQSLPKQTPHPYEYIDLKIASPDTAAIPSVPKDSAYYTPMQSVGTQDSSNVVPPVYAYLK